MNALEQSKKFLKQYLLCKNVAPRVAAHVEDRAKRCLADLNGLGSWRTDYPYTTYHSPQMIDGVLVDLSTSDAVRRHYGVA